MSKKQVAVLMTLVMFLLLFVQPAAAQDFDVAGSSALLMEASTGQILFSKNADQSLPPASITKLMTLLIAFEAIERGQVDWEEPVIVSEAAWRMGGSQLFLNIDQEISFRDLITGISVVSANDGCVAVAEHLYGSEEAFVRVMNERAVELGLDQSSFRNSHGIPAPGHVMSAQDIGELARYLIEKFPHILELESQREFTFNEIRQYNRNPLLGRFPGADGLKTGWTEEAGYCLVGTALQDGVRMISVVLGTTNEDERLIASQELLNHGFRNYTLTVAAKEQESQGEVMVKGGREQTVNIIPKREITVVVPIGRENDVETVLTEENTLTAPVEAGTVAGTLEVRLDNQVLATEEAVTATDMPRAGLLTRIFRAVTGFFGNFFSRRG